MNTFDTSEPENLSATDFSPATAEQPVSEVPETPAQEAATNWKGLFRDDLWVRSLWYFAGAVLSFFITGIVMDMKEQTSSASSPGEHPAFLGSFICFVMVWISTFDQMMNKRLRWIFFAKKKDYPTYFLLLATWLVSCFSLNRIFPIFQESCTWLSVFLVVSIANLGISGLWQASSPVLRRWSTALLGATAVTMFYYTCYLLPVTFFSTLVVWFFGIPFHAYIPFVIFIALCAELTNRWQEHNMRFAIAGGIAAPLILLAAYCNDWWQSDATIRNAFRDNENGVTAGLPDWVVASQRLQRSTRGEQWLKSAVTHLNREDWAWGTGILGNGRQQKVHDPFVLIASLIFPMPHINTEDRLKILRSFYDKRHDTQQRLWRGDLLRTASVQTRIALTPAQRLAYIEKELTIENTEKWPQSQQEAVYSFHLPEGGVVSSLSLWINGVEEKSRLSARSLADSAYRTVVGQERRDPSIVHWQEGNLITLRVFPCTPQEARRFKLGVTAPMTLSNEELVLENVVFEGPDASKAREAIVVTLPDAQNLWHNAPDFLTKKEQGSWQGQRTYKPDFTLRLPVPPVSKTTFRFMGNSYVAQPAAPRMENFHPRTLYLDLHKGWSEKEIKEMLDLAATLHLPVRVWYEGEWFDPHALSGYAATLVLRKNHFSMMPFHLIPDYNAALVVTKSAGATPTLDDLRESRFATEAQKFFSHQSAPLRCWHVGDDLTHYLRSLRELRLLRVETGDWATLRTLLSRQQFYAPAESADTVCIASSRMCIVRATDTTATRAQGNDHLMRLFVYHDVMRRIGAQYWSRRYEPGSLVQRAEEGFVVTPVSSLVVLESQKDYDRFGISANQNTLGNAAIGQKGAVPEPHEWALLLLLVAGLWWYRKRGQLAVSD